MACNEITLLKGKIMSESTPEVVIEETPAVTKPRFNTRKALKAAAVTTGVVAGVVLLKRALSGSVEGEVTATVTTNDQD
jgi:hypothetical protein